VLSEGIGVSRLFGRGFLSLIITQFFGAANDNVLKTVLVFCVVDGLWQGTLGSGGQGIVSLCMFVPFILLSGYGGQVADRFSKRNVSVAVKIAEVPIAVVAAIGFMTGTLWIAMLAMLLLASQSAFFGPSKYGMIPELVDDADLSRANGAINMMTNIAVIGGTLIAGFVTDLFSPQAVPGGVAPEPVSWLPGAVLVAVAGMGLAASFLIPKLPACKPDLKFDLNPVGCYVESLRDMARGPLLMVALAWGYFYFLAGLALLILPEYTVVLQITRAKASMLLGILGVAIGLGSVVAGLVSGRRIEPRLIPIGALGISVAFLLLGFVSGSFAAVAALIFVAGLFAGAYIIPLQAMLQHYSPDDERGRFLGTANAISFAFLATASAVYWVIRPAFGTQPHRIFIICGVVMLVGAAYFMYRLRSQMKGVEVHDRPLPSSAATSREDE
jgi:acyl-[acyl-carrier-protein]-phospholipid O-acyltransferase/long-chain-fatty-acid--[acyl-carrier-protein] ligase